MDVTVKTAHGYLSFQPDGRLEYRDKVGPWETFDVDGLEQLLTLLLAMLKGVPVVGPPPASTNPNHVGPGPLTADRAYEVVKATAREYPQLLAVFPTEELAVSHATQLLLRIIWHLQQAGFQAARQKNPSGAISGDKLCVFFDGRWHVIDVMSFGYAGKATTVQWLEITGENPVPDAGMAD